ncbi:DNA-binding protein [Saccharomonospora sp. CUA-673]|uniref:septation protein SepH n=1 Tax=Saccharomonospora sp. CUA-673 TaxID=1904969 RepID=UPI00096873B3|nr:septation protein SepH [Saccharomonospora sp. CUA-673]OLT43862.1 DNA-binding protein [Saccharomonospora sp. CUA-673]
MRTLRVVGLHEDGESIVCEDPERRERFLLPADARLRAAARGDITRLGQIEIELEAQMRPREIQARVRAGESVDQVAAASGVPVERVERFAYPVLLERSRHADLAQRAHPVREDGPDVQTLAEVVAYAFGVRGHDFSQAEWDAWRGDDAKWVVCLRWSAGRSSNRAHWTFTPGAHGGTVTALDDLAAALLDPTSFRAPRAVTDLGARAARAEAVDADGQEPVLFDYADFDEPDEPTGDTDDTGDTIANVIEAPLPAAAEQEHEQDAPATDNDGSAGDTAHQPADGQGEPAQPGRKKRKGHTPVPAWEDVLLGVRSQRG